MSTIVCVSPRFLVKTALATISRNQDPVSAAESAAGLSPKP